MKKSVFIVPLTKAIAYILRNLLRMRYIVSVEGTDSLNTDNSILFLPNHQALIDPIILISHIYRWKTVLPAISSKYYDFVFFKPFFRSWGAIRVSDLEKGNRDLNVLKDISRATLKGLRRGNCMVIYPSGQIANQGYERIMNKKSAHLLVGRLSENTNVIGVRIKGLWGSMWSKAKTGRSPNFLLQILKGIAFVLVNLIFLLPKRKINLEFVDITIQAKKQAELSRKEFNIFLEQFYNVEGDEPLLNFPYFFWKRK